MAHLSFSFHAIVLLLCSLTLATNVTDHQALLAIKSSITDDPQHVLGSWNTSLHFCQWQGVTCGRGHRRVTILNLRSRGIVGSLSPLVGNLSFLRVLRLENNTFKGVIPPQIGGLFRLQQLILANNSFEGEVPTSLSNCTRLKGLRLAENKLFGKLPQQLSSLINLEIITIRGNGFTGGIPSFLTNFTSLRVISAAFNQLGGSSPHALGQLHNLQIIAFGFCELYGVIPSSLYNLTSLRVFSFTGNQIGGDLPKGIGLQLPKLEIFQIGGNRFAGIIPNSISNFSNMEEINMGGNLFTGKVDINFRYMSHLRLLALFNNSLGSSQPDEMNFIDSMTNCSKLEWLLLAKNQLRGVLPNSVSNLSSRLTVITFDENFIYGSLPYGIGNLVNSEWLSLGNNFLTSVIPNDFGNLRNLKHLDMSGNNFTGIIPDFLGNLPLLRLDMSANSLEGQIPPNLGGCKTLTFLDLSKNNLTGPIPIDLFNLSSLTITLDLSQNHLIGPLPQEIGNLQSLSKLDLSQNALNGEIVDAIGSCRSLEYLYLDASSFQGPIPFSMRTLTGIRILHLSRNNFSGQIPKYLEQLNLSSLNLSFNNFSGEVPIKGIFKNINAFAINGNYRLCGGLPELGLPKCGLLERFKKGSLTSRVVLIVAPLCLFLVATIVLFLYFGSRRRSSKEQHTCNSLMQPFSRVSYGSILKATNGFSQQNQIGMGAFGVVYKGLFEPDGGIVAIKVLKLGNQGALRSFMTECEALKNIRHRNLVKIITACSSQDFQGNDFKALIYEYMPNGNLESWLHPCPKQDTEIEEAPQRLNLRQRLTILMDVAHAIQYLHQDCEVPIIHCDLKPSNILLDSEMVAHVSDFGMAKLLTLKPNESSSIGIRGTIGYAAPEYNLGTEITKEGDIYSFGILLLEMMTGKRPSDVSFGEGLNLHGYVKMAFPDHVMTVIDPTLLSVPDEELEAANIEYGYSEDATKKWKRLEDCMISLGRIGLTCSMESPRERINARKIIHELRSICTTLNSVLPC